MSRDSRRGRTGGRPRKHQAISGGRVSAGRSGSNWRGSVLWVAPFFNQTGYGEEARGYLRALGPRGVPITVRSSGGDSETFVDLLREDPDMAIRLHEGLARKLVSPVTTVIHMPGNSIHRPGGSALTIGRTMFETDGLPEGWAERLNLVDELWVAASFNTTTFRAAGVHVPIHVVPSGVDARAFRPGLSALRLPGVRGTVFLAVFAWHHRKAPDVLLRAWARAFGRDDDVSLVIRSYSDFRFEGDSTAEVNGLVDAELAAAGFARDDVAPIVVIGQQLSSEDMPRLLAAADVYVGVSRGEGFGRPLLEAMSSGLPVIGTRWGGNLDFMSDTNSLLVDIEGLVDIDERNDVEWFRGQRWAEPSVDHLTALLLRAANDEKLRRTLGTRARADVESGWQWHQVARIAERRLRELSGNLGTSGPSSAAGRAPEGCLSRRPRVRWVGDIYGDHGLATVNRELVTRLVAVPEFAVEAVTSEEPPFPRDHVGDLIDVPGAGAVRPDGGIEVEVRHAWPPDFSPPLRGRVVSILPWEYGGVPAEWMEPIRQQIDEIWVPSTWVRSCYLRSGIPEDKVVVVPNGVDTSTFRPEGPQMALGTNRTRKLLFVGGAIYRKGFDLLLDAYLKAFRADDDVCLVVKPFGLDSVYKGSSMEERLLDAAADPSGPAIEVIDRRLTKGELAMLYRSCDALVHPYRGEGFGLPVAEAMGCGLPAVVTGYGACLDFCDDTTGWLIPYKEIPGTMIDWSPGPAGYWWAEPDIAELQRLLRQVAEVDGSELKRRGAAARQRIVENFTWDQAADRARQRLHYLTSGTPAFAPVHYAGSRAD